MRPSCTHTSFTSDSNTGLATRSPQRAQHTRAPSIDLGSGIHDDPEPRPQVLLEQVSSRLEDKVATGDLEAHLASVRGVAEDAVARGLGRAEAGLTALSERVSVLDEARSEAVSRVAALEHLTTNLPTRLQVCPAPFPLRCRASLRRLLPCYRLLLPCCRPARAAAPPVDCCSSGGCSRAGCCPEASLLPPGLLRLSLSFSTRRARTQLSLAVRPDGCVKFAWI